MVICESRFRCDFLGCVASFDYKKSLNSNKSKHSNDKTITDRNHTNLKEKVIISFGIVQLNSRIAIAISIIIAKVA